jgi:hypothetical protein
MKMTLGAITAKYLPATNHLGSRIKVISQRGSATYGIDYSLNFTDQHYAAVTKYLDEIKRQDLKKYQSGEGWGGIDDFAAGVIHSGEYVFVRIIK